MAGKPVYTEDFRQKVLEFKEGAGLNETVKRFKVSPSTVWKWEKKGTQKLLRKSGAKVIQTDLLKDDDSKAAPSYPGFPAEKAGKDAIIRGLRKEVLRLRELLAISWGLN